MYYGDHNKLLTLQYFAIAVRMYSTRQHACVFKQLQNLHVISHKINSMLYHPTIVTAECHASQNFVTASLCSLQGLAGCRAAIFVCRNMYLDHKFFSVKCLSLKSDDNIYTHTS